MTTPVAPRVRPAQLRLAIDAGGDRRDVALRADVLLGDALRAALVPLDQPGTVVLDPRGRALDLGGGVGDQVDDGALLLVVRAAPAPVTSAERWAAEHPDAAERRPAAQAGLLLAATMLSGVVALVVVLWAPDLSPASVAALAGVLGLTALGAAAARSEATASATVAGPAAAFALGALVVLPQDAAERRLALLVGLVLACVAAGVRAVCAQREGSGLDDAVVVGAALVVVTVLQSAALLLDLPAVVATAVTVGLCPLVLRVAPRLALAVPDEQLIDLAHVSRTASSVRGDRPRALGRVDERQVVLAVRRAERRRTVATVLASALPVALLPVVLAGAAGVARWGTLALATCVVLAFALVPRTARGAAVRRAPRAAACAIVVELAVAAPFVAEGRPVAVGVALAGAAALSVSAVLLGRGRRSVVASRLGDAIEALAVVLALPASLVAADLIETLRRMAS